MFYDIHYYFSFVIERDGVFQDLVYTRRCIVILSVRKNEMSLEKRNTKMQIMLQCLV